MKPCPCLSGPEPLRVEVVHHPEPVHLGHRGRQPAHVILGEVAHRDREAVGRGVARRERRAGAPHGLEAQVGVLQVDLPPLHRHQLGGPALLVLQAAVADVGAGHLEARADPLHRLEGGELLLVHQVDAPGTLGVVVEPPGLGDDEVFGALLEPHGSLRARARSESCGSSSARRHRVLEVRQQPPGAWRLPDGQAEAHHLRGGGADLLALRPRRRQLLRPEGRAAGPPSWWRGDRPAGRRPAPRRWGAPAALSARNTTSNRFRSRCATYSRVALSTPHGGRGAPARGGELLRLAASGPLVCIVKELMRVFETALRNVMPTSELDASSW